MIYSSHRCHNMFSRLFSEKINYFYVTSFNKLNEYKFFFDFKRFSKRFYSRYAKGLTSNEIKLFPPWNILFFGTDEYALEHLQALYNNIIGENHLVNNLDVVVPKIKNKKSVVQCFAEEKQLKVFEWPLLKSNTKTKKLLEQNLNNQTNISNDIKNNILNNNTLCSSYNNNLKSNSQKNKHKDIDNLNCQETYNKNENMRKKDKNNNCIYNKLIYINYLNTTSDIIYDNVTIKKNYSNENINNNISNNLTTLNNYNIVNNKYVINKKNNSQNFNEKVYSHLEQNNSNEINNNCDLNNYDVGVVVSFGHLIPQKIIEAFPYGILNVHPSILPRWRGASPIIHTILNDDKVTGISIIEILPIHFDIGPLLLQNKYVVPVNCTTFQLRDYLAVEGSKMLIQALKDLPKLEEIEHEQTENGVTYAHKMSVINARINWEEQTPLDICRQYRALSEIYELRSIWKNIPVKLLDMVPISDMLDIRPELDNAFTEDFIKPGMPYYHQKREILCIKCREMWVAFRNIVIKKSISAKSFYNGYLSKPENKNITFDSLPNYLDKYTFKLSIAQPKLSKKQKKISFIG